MKDCLYTKFKGSSTDENLPKLGELKLKVSNGRLVLLTDGGCTITGLNGVLIDGVAKKQVASGWSSQMIISGLSSDLSLGEIVLTNKYGIYAIIGSVILDSSDDLYALSLQQLQQKDYNNVNVLDDNTVDLSELVSEQSGLTQLVLSGKKVTGAVSDLLPLKNALTVLNGCPDYYNKTMVSGDFGDLGHFKNINSFSNSMITLFGAVRGTVEDFVSARLQEVPATAGSVSINWLGDGGRVTYDGDPIVSKQNNTIAWDAQGNITLS